MNRLIRFSDVTARDGLQSLNKIISPDNRTFLVKVISRLKFDEIEIGSLVNPSVIPTMAGSMEVYNSTLNPDKYKSYLLVGNMNGIDIINENKIKYFSLFTSPSDTFNQKNINTNVDGSFKRFEKMIGNLNNRDEHHIKGYISCIGECPFEGDTSVDSIIKTVEKYKELNVNEICIADTIATLKPNKLNNILEECNKIYDISKISLHLHTRDEEKFITKENLRIATNHGINKFDTSLFGIGGCPAVYCKNDEKTGNLNIFDAVKYLTELGCEFEHDYKSQEWEEELFNVENHVGPILF